MEPRTDDVGLEKRALLKESTEWNELPESSPTYTDDAEYTYRDQSEGANQTALATLRESLLSDAGAEASDDIPYQRIKIDAPLEQSPDTIEVCRLLHYAAELRDKYLYVPSNEMGSFSMLDARPDMNEEIPGSCESIIQEKGGVWRVYASQEDLNEEKPAFPVKSFSSYAKDLYQLTRIISYGPCKTVCFGRLKLLESKFEVHKSLNEQREANAQKMVPHRDFYNLRKVDGHVHHSSSMNQKHLLKFIKRKLRDCGDEVVIFRDGNELTLNEVFESLNLTRYQLSVDTLDVHAHNDTFHRFDKFNLKYNPCGQSRLREIFLKTDNLVKGRYLAELTKELAEEMEASKYQCTEWRISIYGRNSNEWNKLSHWVIDNELYSDNNRWLIQIPRLFSIYKANKTQDMRSFLDLLRNVFEPLFEVTKNPQSNPTLHQFLKQVAGFDTVDDESKPERNIAKGIPAPAKWTTDKNPPYNYYLYYMYANITSLNQFREAKGMNTFSFRPHCGEAGDTSHLAGTFLLATSINHGINLRKAPVLHYLYYLKQIGLAMSPLSNNALFLHYSRNPFPEFFARGMNVALSSDDPLQFHYSKEALIEEYSVAKAVWRLTSCDLSEIARNSVLQSGFEHQLKSSWLGDQYWLQGVNGNDIRKTNIPDIRISFREEALQEEWKFINEGDAQSSESCAHHPIFAKLSRW